MSTSEVPDKDPVQPSSSPTSSTFALTRPTPGASGTKRRRETNLDPYKSEPVVDLEPESENVPKAAVSKEQTARPTPFKNTCSVFEEEKFEETCPPQRKRRLITTSLVREDSQPLVQAWSQDPLFTSSQYTESECYLTNQKNTTVENLSDSEPSFLNGLQSEEAFHICMDAEARTSTQKPFKHTHFSQVDDDKENCWFSPSKHSSLSHIEPISNHKWTKPQTASPRKHIPVHSWKNADKEDSHDSEFKWAKPRSSPLKKPAPQQSCTVADEESLAMLFTQDSQGFRVIAHRGLQARSPLKDQSNKSIRTMRSGAYKSLVEEEEDEDEMLFTQDSQGNLVIKH